MADTKTKGGKLYKQSSSGKWFLAGNQPGDRPSLAERLKSVPGLLARYQSNPGLRSKLPDSYLSPAQQAARKHNAFLANISNPAGTLAGPSLVDAAHQISNSEFDPLLADIGRQEHTIDARTAAQHDFAKRYYGDVGNLFGSIGGAQDRANTASVAGAQQRGAATQTAITGAADQARQRMAADAAVRGPGLEGSAPSDLAARTAVQQGQAAQDAQRAQGAASDFGGAQAAFLRGLQGASAQQGGELQGQITAGQQKQLGDLASQRADLRGQQVGRFTDTLLKLRQQEADNLFTKAGLNLDSAKLAAASQPSASDQKTAADLAFFKKHGYYPATGPPKKDKGPSVSDQKTQQEIDFFNKHGYYPTTGPPKGKSNGGTDWATSGQQGTAQDEVGSALTDAKRLKAAGWDRHKAASALLNGAKGSSTPVYDTKTGKRKLNADGTPVMKNSGGLDKHDALWTSVALDVLYDGHISRYNAKRLHARGIKVDALGFPTYTDYSKNHPQPTGPGRDTSYGGGAGAGSGTT